jgi:hypothetical protein
MASKKNIMKDLDFLSDRISTQVRTVALGLLAMSWGLLIGRSDVAIKIAGDMKKSLMFIGGIAFLTMFLDFLQYFFGYLYTSSLLKQMEREKREETRFSYSDCRYVFRTYLFWGKQIFLIIGVLWFVIVLCKYLF